MAEAGVILRKKGEEEWLWWVRAERVATTR